ncbi:hypothetical protein PV417_26015 [Streptomyces sp. ME19-03-3]|nr:hypothetical protein [Streptomyces sp. ME19-03-3]
MGGVLLRLVGGGLLRAPPLGLVLRGLPRMPRFPRLLPRMPRFPRLLLSWPHGWEQ